MDVRRFGPGHRRTDGPQGSTGVEGAVIYADERVHVSELAFGRYAMVAPHSNAANSALFVVISGGGFVQVGDERTRVNHGEAIVWPPRIPHGAYTDGSEMRAIVIEMRPGDEGATIEGEGYESRAGDQATRAARAEGRLAPRATLRDEYDASEGEPW